MGVGSGEGVKREGEMGREVEGGWGRMEREGKGWRVRSERRGGEKGREREWRERRIELEENGGEWDIGRGERGKE